MHPLESRWAVHKASGEVALTILRVVAGVVMIYHGWAKLMDVAAWQIRVTELGLPAPVQLAWLALATEILGGLGLAVGLLTPVATLGIAVIMVTAIVQVHWGHGLFASQGGMELPLLMLCIALTFMLRGAGPFSLDALAQYGRKRTLRTPADSPAPTVPEDTSEHPAHWSPEWSGSDGHGSAGQAEHRH